MSKNGIWGVRKDTFSVCWSILEIFNTRYMTNNPFDWFLNSNITSIFYAVSIRNHIKTVTIIIYTRLPTYIGTNLNYCRYIKSSNTMCVSYGSMRKILRQFVQKISFKYVIMFYIKCCVRVIKQMAKIYIVICALSNDNMHSNFVFLTWKSRAKNNT